MASPRSSDAVQLSVHRIFNKVRSATSDAGQGPDGPAGRLLSVVRTVLAENTPDRDLLGGSEQRDDKACLAMCTLELIQAFSSNLSFEQFEH